MSIDILLEIQFCLVLNDTFKSIKIYSPSLKIVFFCDRYALHSLVIIVEVSTSSLGFTTTIPEYYSSYLEHFATGKHFTLLITH
jgi:hypothetical protein